MENCLISCGLFSNDQLFDHYQDVKDKFPKILETYFLPLPVKSEKQRPKKKSYNRVVDESIITQMSNCDLSKFKSTNLTNIIVKDNDAEREKFKKQKIGSDAEVLVNDFTNRTNLEAMINNQNSLSNPFLQIN